MSDDDSDSDSDGRYEPDIEALVRQFGGRLWFAQEGRAQREDVYVPIAKRAPRLDQIEDALTRDPARSLAVIAEDGAGKTSLIRAATRRLHDQGATVFEATSTDVIAGQTYIGQLEGRVQAIAQASKGRPVVWVLTDPQDAIGAGAWRGDPSGLLDRMLPYVERGELQLIVEATPEAWATLEQLKPAVARVLERIRLEPLSDEETLAVARGWLQAKGVTMTDATLQEAHEVAQEHLSAAVAPGDLLRLLQATHERLSREETGAASLGRDDILRTLGELSGMPVALIDEERRLDLERLTGFFEQRVLGQPEAVELLVQRIAMIKAGLTDPTRPLGVFLFVGPTGTGKTELAKALAEYLFGSAKRLVRLDMSEFQTFDSLDRLLAGPRAEESADFLPAIRRQPFSVVLLDEFEKAHPRIWDAFLQVFDDARLTDRRGATADFRHAVVIMTSNLGASVRQSGPVGFAATHGPQGGFERAVAQAFRPEFVNRIDRIVAFRHLTRDVMRLLVRKELQAVTKRRGLRTRPWSVEWDESAVDFLLERGFTTDLGARPLKRAVEEHVLAPLARAIVEHEVPRGDQFLFVRAQDGEGITVEFIDPEAEAPAEPPPAEPGDKDLPAIALDPTGSPEEVATLEAAFAAVEQRVTDGGFAERKDAILTRMGEPEFWDDPGRFAALGEAEYLDRIDAGLAGAGRLLRRLTPRGSAEVARLVAQRLHLLRLALDALAAGEPADAFVRVRAQQRRRGERPHGQARRRDVPDVGDPARHAARRRQRRQRHRARRVRLRRLAGAARGGRPARARVPRRRAGIRALLGGGGRRRPAARARRRRRGAAAPGRRGARRRRAGEPRRAPLPRAAVAAGPGRGEGLADRQARPRARRRLRPVLTDARRRHRRRPERPRGSEHRRRGGPRRDGRRGAARAGRCRPVGRDHGAGLRPRPVQLVLSVRRGVAGDARARPRALGAALAARPARARPSHARRPDRRPVDRSGRDRRVAGRVRARRRRRVARAVRAVGAGRGPVHGGVHDALPAPPRRAACAPPRQDRRRGGAPLRGEALPRRAAAPCCSPATPSTPTCRWTPRAARSSASSSRRSASTTGSRSPRAARAR